MGGRRNPRCLVEPLQKLKNRKAEADQRRGRPHPGHQGALHAHARAQPGKMRRRVPLDFESTGSSSLFATSHETYLYFFPNLAPPSTEFILSLAEGLRACFASLREVIFAFIFSRSSEARKGA